MATARDVVVVGGGHNGPVELILGVLAGELSLADAGNAGLVVSGSRPALRRLLSSRRWPATP
jgi:hypothetical protein